MAIQLAHRTRKIWWRLRRPQTLGVKVLVRNPNNEILLVKPSYSQLWQIPGGGVHKHEHPLQAGIREIREETDIVLVEDEMTLAGVFVSSHEGKSDCVVFYTTMIDSGLPVPDASEISDARFYSPVSLPLDTAPSVHRRLAGKSSDGNW